MTPNLTLRHLSAVYSCILSARDYLHRVTVSGYTTEVKLKYAAAHFSSASYHSRKAVEGLTNHVDLVFSKDL